MSFIPIASEIRGKFINHTISNILKPNLYRANHSSIDRRLIRHRSFVQYIYGKGYRFACTEKNYKPNANTEVIVTNPFLKSFSNLNRFYEILPDEGWEPLDDEIELIDDLQMAHKKAEEIISFETGIILERIKNRLCSETGLCGGKEPVLSISEFFIDYHVDSVERCKQILKEKGWETKICVSDGSFSTRICISVSAF